MLTKGVSFNSSPGSLVPDQESNLGLKPGILSADEESNLAMRAR